MQKYNKFITALVGATVTAVSIYFDSPEWLQIVVPALTALGVYQIPNKK